MNQTSPTAHSKPSDNRITLTACPVCQAPSEDSEHLLASQVELKGQVLDYTVELCRICGAMFEGRRSRYEALYSPTANIERKHGHQPLVFVRESIWNLENKRQQVNAVLQAVQPSDFNYLEVGASDGSLFYLLQEAAAQQNRRVRATLVESSGAANACSQLPGCRVISRSFMEPNVELEPGFDVAVLSHCFEHFDNPQAVLDKLYALLKPQGIVFIEVPDAERCDQSVSYPLGYYHVVNYSLLTLTGLLTIKGFEVVDALQCPHYPGLRLIARKAATETKGFFFGPEAYARMAQVHRAWQDNRQRIFENLKNNKALARGKILLYGAGTHTTALLDAFPDWLADQRVDICDSDREIVTLRGQRLIPQEEIRLEQYSAVIISSYAYQEQIAASLRQRGCPDEKIIRLYARIFSYTG